MRVLLGRLPTTCPLSERVPFGKDECAHSAGQRCCAHGQTVAYGVARCVQQCHSSCCCSSSGVHAFLPACPPQHAHGAGAAWRMARGSPVVGDDDLLAAGELELGAAHGLARHHRVVLPTHVAHAHTQVDTRSRKPSSLCPRPVMHAPKKRARAPAGRRYHLLQSPDRQEAAYACRRGRAPAPSSPPACLTCSGCSSAPGRS